MTKQPRQGPDLLACAGLVIALALILLWLFAQEAKADHLPDNGTTAMLSWQKGAFSYREVHVYASVQQPVEDHRRGFDVCERVLADHLPEDREGVCVLMETLNDIWLGGTVAWSWIPAPVVRAMHKEISK